MALLNRFSKLNDRAETGIFTFIVTKSVTRDFHRDATTKDFCFGYHRWAISFQRPSEKVLGVHLLLRNPSPNTSCVVDFTLSLLNREHFSQNEVYTKRQAKFTITNPMQGVARWIQMSDLVERRFSNETGEFLFELALSNMTTIFECDIQLNPTILTQYKAMLRAPQPNQSQEPGAGKRGELINLETNCFTFGAFDWSLTIVPLAVASGGGGGAHADSSSSASSSSSTNQQAHLLTPSRHRSSSSLSLTQGALEPVCRVYLNRLNGFDCLCRVRYRVILGHHQASGQHPAEFVDSRLLDQLSDASGRIRGHQFKGTNILKLISVRSSGGQHSSLDLRVHIEMYCANTISEARVPLQRKPNEPQVSNCSDRNKQAWCVEADSEAEFVRLKLFFMDLASVPRNHIRYISWIAYVVRRESRAGGGRESVVVRNSPHSNYYLQDGIDMGAIMDTHIPVKELANSPKSYLCEGNQQCLTVHIEWVDSLLLFSHLYNNYDALATMQRHQISRELNALQQELELLERKYAHTKRALNQLLAAGQAGSPPASPPLGRRGSGARGGSLQFEAGAEAGAYAAAPPPQPPAKSRLELVASVSAPAAAAKLPPQGPRDHWPDAAACGPMSLEERLQLSSSTPPRLPLPARPSVRRRLPPQPTAYAPACLSPSPPSGAQCSSNSLDRLMADQQVGQVEGDTQCYAALGTGALHQHQQPRRSAQLPAGQPFSVPLYQDKMLPAEAAGDDELQSEALAEPQVPQVQRYSFQQDAHLALKSELEAELAAHLEPAELYVASHGYHLQRQQQPPPPLTDDNGRLLVLGDDFTTDQLLLGDPHQAYEHYNRLQ